MTRKIQVVDGKGDSFILIWYRRKWIRINTAPIGNIYNRNNEIIAIKFVENMIAITMIDGRIISMPLSWFPFLENATPEQRENYELSSRTVNWDEFDDGFSIEPLLLGKPKTA